MTENSKVYLIDKTTGEAFEFAGLQSVNISPNRSVDEVQTYEFEGSIELKGFLTNETASELVGTGAKGKELEVETDIPFLVQRKRHKKHRTNKKWLKKYGYKTVYKKARFEAAETEIKQSDNDTSFNMYSGKLIKVE